MKRLLVLIISLIFSQTIAGQNNEFKVYPNGLIYSERAMIKLQHVVDSLNLKFKTCDLDKKFYAKSQTVGHIIELDTGDIQQARIDLENQISFEAFVKKYPLAKIERNKLIIKRKYLNYEDQEIVEIEHFSLEHNYGFGITSTDLNLYHKGFKNQWLVDYNEANSYYKEYINAFYFPKEFTTREIPQKYSLMIGYSECLIDTTSSKLKDDLVGGTETLPKNWRKLSQKKKARLLENMRNTEVIGFCSQDSRPRDHAVSIALLSAETYNWEVFLKAHLDIMNDRFERVSDGSYAWGARDTYIRELEELNINVLDLILGISFRIENPASNHYYGSIGRIGRALAEAENSDEIEETILSTIVDKELDDFNRLLFYFLFRNYNYYIEDEQQKKANSEKLALAVKTLPEYYQAELAE